MITKRLGVEHLGYKIIALLITLILWVTVVSQREMVSTQKLTVQFVVPLDFQIEGSNQAEVTVQIEGPRPFMRKFIERSWPSAIVVPIRNPSVGPFPAEVPMAELQLPSEIKVLSINPREVVLQINKKSSRE
jgi:YbbR domain-containing protein